jgi:serine/threonine protein kinase
MIQGFDYSCPSDCWSFGIMIYELLCLDLPFNGASTGALVKCILDNEPEPLPSFYSEELR